MNPEKVAVVGGGPAGMTVSRELKKKDYEVHIYDKMEEIGGLWIFGLPDWRMDKSKIEKKIKETKERGIKVHTGVEVGKDIELDELIDGFDAVILATGAWDAWMPPWEGIDLPSVFHGFTYLLKRNLYKRGYISKDATLKAKGRTYVIGGGNTAMDACREAAREGADVHLLYRRSRELMPCSDQEFKDTR
nr:FAD-dependent oxidoreductase [Candidatus Korarchaeota archaeon]NIU84049.1 FAD-dependent oxidoreductase [Candidatus Thorarchaeota archaeon]NIW14192.1 FAD-dependent oxidoreductase [Candidatus Thorarchaeota archaeon]NIW52298.1 FAD-dependent oxidoreductase [Candidatus Korarchaeota archaeon]